MCIFFPFFAAMLAAIGMLVTEEPIEFHPLFEAANKDIGPAIRHLDEVRGTLYLICIVTFYNCTILI